MKNKGFTLVELLAVITLIGLIALVTVAAVSRSLGKSKETIANNQVEQIENAARLWMADHQMIKPNDSDSSEICNYAEINSCPKDYKTLVITLGDLQSEGYLDNNVKDLKTKETISTDTKIKIVLDGKKIIYKINIGTSCPYSGGDTFDFAYTGSVQTFTAECEGNYKLEVWGAQGGASSAHTKIGGKGGYSVGIANIDINENLYIYVGGQGNTGSYAVDGGWNGGGGVTNSYHTGGTGSHLGTGGGATDICTVSSSVTKDEYYRYVRTQESYNSRIIVAGGGGGAESVDGAAGGGVSGIGSQPGTQSSAGAATNSNASSWVTMYSGGLGYGVSTTGGHTNHAMGSCGGGGYYGGGAYGYNGSSAYGSGGSGYVSSSLTNAQTIAGNTSFPSPTGGNETGHEGNGFARITYLGE